MRSASSSSRKRNMRTHVHFDRNSEEAGVGFDSNNDLNQAFSEIKHDTFSHLFKSLLGTGIFAMPKAFCYSGWFAGIVGTALIALISTHCIHILFKSQNEICRRLKVRSLTYGETARSALLVGPACCVKYARSFRFLIDFFLIVDQVGTCCIYVIFVASNVKEVVDQYARPMDVRIYVLLLMLSLPLLGCGYNPRYIAPYSALANLTTFVSCGITFYYVFSDLPPLGSRKIIGSIKDLPFFIGVVLFSVENNDVVSPLRNDMRNPKIFGEPRGPLNTVMFVLTTSYVAAGFFGYLKYGDDALGSITLNLPEEDGLAQSARIMLCCSVFLRHALPCYVVADDTWSDYLSWMFFRDSQKYAIRALAVLMTLVVAVLVPNLEVFISTFGALCLTLLAVSFPVIMETTTFWYTTAGFGFYGMCAKNFLLALFGFSVFVAGASYTVVEIVGAKFL